MATCKKIVFSFIIYLRKYIFQNCLRKNAFLFEKQDGELIKRQLFFHCCHLAIEILIQNVQKKVVHVFEG